MDKFTELGTACTLVVLVQKLLKIRRKSTQYAKHQKPMQSWK